MSRAAQGKSKPPIRTATRARKTDAMHMEKQTLRVEVNIPAHEPRESTTIFERSRRQLIQREGGRCWVCHCTAEQTGHPMEAHHHPIERSFANAVDWSEGSQIRKDFPKFGWGSFDERAPYAFVDDMNVNGRLLCKQHHTTPGTGVHTLPEPIWVIQRYMKEGYPFNSVTLIHHDYSQMKVHE